jgi:hypothetical protein
MSRSELSSASRWGRRAWALGAAAVASCGQPSAVPPSYNTICERQAPITPPFYSPMPDRVHRYGAESCTSRSGWKRDQSNPLMMQDTRRRAHIYMHAKRWLALAVLIRIGYIHLKDSRWVSQTMYAARLTSSGSFDLDRPLPRTCQTGRLSIVVESTLRTTDGPRNGRWTDQTTETLFSLLLGIDVLNMLANR